MAIKVKINIYKIGNNKCIYVESLLLKNNKKNKISIN